MPRCAAGSCRGAHLDEPAAGPDGQHQNLRGNAWHRRGPQIRVRPDVHHAGSQRLTHRVRSRAQGLTAPPMFTMRFDMRTPASGAPTPALYDAALQMCAWAETRGAIIAVLSEHHATADGHLPSPLILASAIAARTKVLNILVAAATLPLYHPVRLAEDMTVLDNLSKGRVHYVFGIGHRPQEYEHMGVDVRRRGRVADESLELL